MSVVPSRWAPAATAACATVLAPCPYPSALTATWWAERFDAEIIANMDGFFVIVAGGSPPTQLAFQKVEYPTPGKNKVHLDVQTDGDLDAEVERWTAAGATSLGKRNAGDFFWITLTDPDGNEFCIAGS